MNRELLELVLAELASGIQHTISGDLHCFVDLSVHGKFVSLQDFKSETRLFEEVRVLQCPELEDVGAFFVFSGVFKMLLRTFIEASPLFTYVAALRRPLLLAYLTNRLI